MKMTIRKIFVLCITIASIFAVTSICKDIAYIRIVPLRIAAYVGVNLLNAVIAFAGMKLTKMPINIDFKNKKSYLIGIGIAAGLCLVVGIIPTLFGFDFAGSHMDFSWYVCIYNFLYYMLVIGPAEEFVFRVYIQEVATSFFSKHKWIGVVLTSLLFGFWHIINGTPTQVMFASAIGLVYGFAKYKIKDCGFVGASVAHGLYDYSLTLVRFFIA